MLTIALAQMEVIPGHPDQNTASMLKFIAKAKKQKVDLIIFPEMAVPGYLLGDTWEEEAFLRDCQSYGETLREAASGITVIFGNIAIDPQKKNQDGRIRKYNALFIAQEGKFLQPPGLPYPFLIKTLMPNYREFDDTRHFFSLQQLAQEEQKPAETFLNPVPLTIQERTYQLGCLICEDGWSDDYALSPRKILTEKGPLDLLINISASPYTLGKNAKRHRVFCQQAKESAVPLLYVNHIGLQNNGKTIFTFDGTSTVYSRQGKVLLSSPSYQTDLLIFSLESLDTLPEKEMETPVDIASIDQALVYGTRKFLERIHMDHVVVGISGGIDSAVSAALYTRVLGPDRVLLINMPSVYNSATTRGLAAQLAKNLGCRSMVVPIQHAVDHTVEQLTTIPIDSPFTPGQHERLTVTPFLKENIQARDRSARILAGAAAAFGGGFTCNANKAETTVGYSTLYGDQSGFLAALADLWKGQIYALAAYMNQEIFHAEIIPQASIDIVPSAELSTNQNVDEGKGDPLKYPYHDALFRSFVERWQKASPEDILDWYAKGCLEQEIGCAAGLVSHYFPTPQAFIEDLEHWWNLFCGMAVAKRIQAPPVIAISRRAFGFDHREAQNGAYYTKHYHQLKQQLLHV